MKTVSLSGSLRANVGKVDANALRAKGLVPCVIYGGKEQTHFYADSRAFKDIIYTPDTNLVSIELEGGKNFKAVLQEAQFHKINDRLIHADFLEVSEDKPVTVQIPVKAIGQAEGVKDGGKMSVKMRKLKVKGLISKLPARIELNVEKLTIGKSISVGDINIDGLTILHPKNISVISVNITRNVVEETSATATTATPAATADATATPAATADAKTPPPAKK
jgi:large subunit ribosomal protein L25